MATVERFTLAQSESANKIRRYVSFDLSRASVQGNLVIQLATEPSRKREGRQLAQRYALAVSDRPRVEGVWLAQAMSDTDVTVVAHGLDEELEFRLHDIFESLAAASGDPSIGQLFIYDADEELPPGVPSGEKLLATETMS